jgi:hypothetical protein
MCFNTKGKSTDNTSLLLTGDIVLPSMETDLLVCFFSRAKEQNTSLVSLNLIGREDLVQRTNDVNFLRQGVFS